MTINRGNLYTQASKRFQWCEIIRENVQTSSKEIQLLLMWIWEKKIQSCQERSIKIHWVEKRFSFYLKHLCGSLKIGPFTINWVFHLLHYQINKKNLKPHVCGTYLLQSILLTSIIIISWSYEHAYAEFSLYLKLLLPSIYIQIDVSQGNDKHYKISANIWWKFSYVIRCVDNKPKIDFLLFFQVFPSL